MFSRFGPGSRVCDVRLKSRMGSFHKLHWAAFFFIFKGLTIEWIIALYTHRGSGAFTNNHNAVDKSGNCQPKALYSEAGERLEQGTAETTSRRAAVFCSFCSGETTASERERFTRSQSTQRDSAHSTRRRERGPQGQQPGISARPLKRLNRTTWTTIHLRPPCECSIMGCVVNTWSLWEFVWAGLQSAVPEV